MPLVRPVAALLAIVSLQCGAAPFAIQLGDTRVALDAPPGFADTTFTGSPRLQDIAESLTSPSNRVLLFALSDGDLRRFTQGDIPDLKRFMIASTPKEFERERVTPAAFARLTGDLSRDLEALRDLGNVPTGTDYPGFLDRQAPGKAAALAEIVRQPDTLSLLQGTRLPAARSGEKPQYLLSSTTLLLVRGRVLSLAVYASYESPADPDWVRSVTVRWIEELKRLNSR
jgi:hypothetical protein